MANALDYIAWRGDLSFEISPINEVDLFLLSQLSMPDYEGIVKTDMVKHPLYKVAKTYFKDHDLSASQLGLLQAEGVLPALKLMGESTRFKDISLCTYINKVKEEREEQFSAISFRLTDNVIVVSYRGTDDTIIGWKEDCHLAIYDEVPAQIDALRYLEKIANNNTEKIILVGHSKGGNLAIYAAAKADKEIQNRIIRVISYDGPGFNKPFFKEEGYKNVAEKITTIVSQNSIIGTLLYPAGTVVYVKADVEGLVAHDGFHWEATTNHFTREKGLSVFSKEFNKAMDKTMDVMSTEDKKAFVDELFSILFSSGADTLSAFMERGVITRLDTLKKITKSKKVREFAIVLTKALVKS